MKDHTAAHREVIAANLARVEAARKQARLHGEDHNRRVRRRHDDLLKEQAKLEAQLGNPTSWSHDDLHELDQIQRERRSLSRLMGE